MKGFKKIVEVDVSEYSIDWIKSVLKHFAKRHTMLVQHGQINRDFYPNLERWKWRLQQVHPDFVCAELKDAKYHEERKVLTFQCEFLGPYAVAVVDRQMVPRFYNDGKRNAVPLVAFEFV